MRELGLNALVRIIFNFTFIYLTFRVINSLHFEYYVNQERQRTFRLLIIIIATALGFLVSQFFLNFIDSVRNLGYLL